MKLSKLFNFKKQEEPENAELVSSITYSIDKNGEMFIDITLDSFDEYDLKKFAELIITVSSQKCHLTTVEMVKNNFEKENKIKELTQLVQLILDNKVNTTTSEHVRKATEEPCIKPSDML